MAAHPLRVLVVEDEALVAMTAQDALEDAGCAVALAHDGASALGLAGSEPFDVAVVDLGLPDMPGEVLLARLRTVAPATRLMVSTGHGPSAVRERGGVPPGVPVLAKPWDPDDLVAGVANTAGNRGAGPGLA